MIKHHRIERLERAIGIDEDPLVVAVDRPGDGPTDPVERAAWLQSRIPAGAKNVRVIKIVYEARPIGRLHRED